MEDTIKSTGRISSKVSSGKIPEILTAGVDFGFAGGSSRPILYKSGAEKLLAYLKLSLESLQCVNSVTDVDKNFVDYTYKCILQNSSGIITGISEGSSNSCEEIFRESYAVRDVNKLTREEYRKKLADGNGKWKKQDGRWLWMEKITSVNVIGMKNFIQKTAQKRAFVGAVLMSAGLADVFGQI